MIEDTYTVLHMLISYTSAIHMYVRAECRWQQVQNLILRPVSKNNIFLFWVKFAYLAFKFIKPSLTILFKETPFSRLTAKSAMTPPPTMKNKKILSPFGKVKTSSKKK